MGHNTQLPTCGMLSGKWRVERHENLTGPGHVWCAFHNEHDIEETHRHFTTWLEALDYADQQARTTTVTLPRVKHDDHVIAGKGLYSLHVNHGQPCTDIYLGGWDGVTVENKDLEALALYLLALAARNGATNEI